ncbi:MAG: hypothetical protein WC641_03775 [Patescibacteria group bacterium]
MLTEFATIQFSREELVEIHRALLQRVMLEDELRKERGLEKPDRHPLLEKIEMLLGEREPDLQEIDMHVEDELWEFAWYVYTDEWAWYRAGQEAAKGENGKPLTDASRLKTLTEKFYRDNFDRYAAEIDMHELKKSKSLVSRQNKEN